MKNLLFALSLISLQLCLFSPSSFAQNTANLHQYDLIQTYKRHTTTGNQSSQFAVKNRKIEAQYRILENAEVEITLMLTTGYNEGEVSGGIEIRIGDNWVKKLNPLDLNTREYVKDLSYTSSTPLFKNKTIADPGGIDTEIQADGSQKQIHRAPSTKTVTVLENEQEFHSKQQSQIFNIAKFKVDTQTMEKIKNSDMFTIKVYCENESIQIFPRKSHIKEIKRSL